MAQVMCVSCPGTRKRHLSQSSLYPTLKFGDGSVGLEMKAPLRWRCLRTPLMEFERDGKVSVKGLFDDIRVIGSSRSISVTDMSEHCDPMGRFTGVVGSSCSNGD